MELNFNVQKKDGLTPLPWTITVREALKKVVTKNQDGTENVTWEPNYRQTKIGKVPTGSTLRSQGYWVARLGGFVVRDKIGDIPIGSVTSVSAQSYNFFENSQYMMFSEIDNAFAENRFLPVGREYPSRNTANLIVKDAKIMLDNNTALVIWGNRAEWVVDWYIPHTVDRATGENVILQATRGNAIKGYNMQDVQKSNIMRSFVLATEDADVVYNREFNLRVKPYLIENAIETVDPNASDLSGHEEPPQMTEQELAEQNQATQQAGGKQIQMNTQPTTGLQRKTRTP